MQLYNLTKKWNKEHTHVINLDKEWEKKYLKPLQRKIDSLLDYIYFFNKDYLIINSSNTTEDSIYIDDKTLDKVKDDAIEDLQPDYPDDAPKDVPIYLPWKLLYRQGFINNNMDGFLLFKEIYEIPQENINAVRIPTGYCCICTYQSEGEKEGKFQDIPFDEYRKRYALYPISSGGLYIPRIRNKNLEFKYYKNILGKFVNNLPLVLSLSPLRYISEFDVEGSRYQYVLQDYNSENKPSIKNKDDIAWTGGADLTYGFFLGSEEIFCDNSFSIGEDVQNYSFRNKITINLENPIKLEGSKLKFF